MTRASTSAANFGLLLVALVLMLHSVVGDLIPRHVRRLAVDGVDNIDQCFLTKLAPNNKEKLMIKDADMKYPNLGGVNLVYSNFDPSTGCKDITLKRGDNSVSDEDGDGRDIDTKNYEETKKTLCSKWIDIHVKRDG
ncbi:related to Mig1 protein [Ustilago bromivora]|uniref:Related to Mig1 protein n=1 Tax=Ustilago bromivora TaxID=307758 RepID=A0A1K0H8B7_9BASI|nr:related to Mig1 protein [Ustilago bromivora]SYW78209.1 related to Mig1 protein, induced during biotrophic phase [Ustilago bromivora]